MLIFFLGTCIQVYTNLITCVDHDIYVIFLIEPLIQNEDCAALGMKVEHILCTLYFIIHTLAFISLPPNKHFNI